MKSDGLALYPIFPQCLQPLLRPCANEGKVCVRLVNSVPCPGHEARFSLGESHHHVSKLCIINCILQGSKLVEI